VFAVIVRARETLAANTATRTEIRKTVTRTKLLFAILVNDRTAQFDTLRTECHYVQAMSKPKECDDGIELILRGWPHLPEHVRKTLLEIVSHYESPAALERFPTPAGAAWTDVEIVLISPDEAEIRVGSVCQRYTFAAAGLADKRNPKRPRREWRKLRTYAENTEDPDAYYKLPKRASLKADISLFRLWLQRFFGIAGDPLKPFKTGLWRPRFKIRVDY
jgi:hypothetical protein